VRSSRRASSSPARYPRGRRGRAREHRHLKTSASERRSIRRFVASLRRDGRGGAAPNDQWSHIVPLMVGDPVLCKQVSDMLLRRLRRLRPAINYPTVRAAPSVCASRPHRCIASRHRHLVRALSAIWSELRLRRRSDEARSPRPNCPVTGGSVRGAARGCIEIDATKRSSGAAANDTAKRSRSRARLVAVIADLTHVSPAMEARSPPQGSIRNGIDRAILP